MPELMGSFFCFEFYYLIRMYALKGQKLLAQGIALGSYVCKPVALSGRVFKIRLKSDAFIP